MKILLLLVSLIVAYGSYLLYINTNQYYIDLKLPVNTKIEFSQDKIKSGHVQFTRMPTSGILHMDAEDDISFAKGLGYAHAHDRYAQLFTLRLIGQGRLSECFAASEQSLIIDTIMRQMSFAENAKSKIHLLSDRVLQLVEAYAEGINEYIEKHDRPLDFILAGYVPESWKAVDSLMIASLVGFAGLASAQMDQEKFIISALKSGNKETIDLVKRLYSPHLDQFDQFVSQEILDKLSLEVPLIPEHIAIFKKIPQLIGSNNWVVSGKKSVSGKPIMAFDPHLDISRIPGFWYEVSAKISGTNTSIVGVSVPGIVGIVMGRTNKVASSFTYGFMDMVDYFIEDCRDMKCRDDNDYVPVEKSVSTLKRKGDSDIDIVTFKTRNGVLEFKNSSSHTFPDGYYLSRAYTHERGPGGVGTLSTIALSHTIKSLSEMSSLVVQTDTSTNLLLADDEGNIGLYQTGLAPVRASSGLFPLLGWNREHQWKGFIPGGELKRVINPEEGFIATANNEQNDHHMVVNTHMGEYRADRIKQLLSTKQKFSVEDFKPIQRDKTSLQAAEFMKYLRPVLKKRNDSVSQALMEWNLQYDEKSRGAFLFEMFYRQLLMTVYGRIIGEEAWRGLTNTAVVVEFFHYFDRVLLEKEPRMEDNALIWQSKTREEIFEEVWSKVQEQLVREEKTMTQYGQYHQLTLWNLFYRAILPDSLGLYLGIHKGPFPFLGSRATVQQAQIFTQGPMESTFGASYRCVTDMSELRAQSSLPGGSSDNILSPLYANRLQSFFADEYAVTDL